ncbi:MAG: hypothetical protein AB7I42_24070 [Bradyrhizobium sp.]|uniref:hypothetical protein n=1 Tax=Bradyrhizobium sp. TaxID=376 RepID=UPI003D09AE98
MTPDDHQQKHLDDIGRAMQERPICLKCDLPATVQGRLCDGCARSLCDDPPWPDARRDDDEDED